MCVRYRLALTANTNSCGVWWTHPSTAEGFASR